MDLRHLRGTLLGRVVRRHNLNWGEIQMDERKFGGMQRGTFCQSVSTEIEALCPHGNPIAYNRKPLRLHMCFGADNSDPFSSADFSVQQGLDFTSDLCDRHDSCGSDPAAKHLSLAEEVALRAAAFSVGSVVKYNSSRVQFEKV
ncbi:MAG: hypothetical protein KGI78_00085 [Patescibacteria group bacterium]|nr:hypothetical protein [Patescibacteria group bacterium]MDE1944296.1 hypothetical protein [Patescibacteria group bacterium]MDE1944783.1 hypothetical protein [Patescibacteria group bacterium]MDE2057236.1 hypothetical protein [Patescibacteria group bacterium]